MKLLLVALTLLLGAYARGSSAQDHAQHGHHAHSHAHTAAEPTQSEREHVPPPPPQLVLPHLSADTMSELMQMDDAAAIALVQADQLEWRAQDGADVLAWKLHAWYGNDYDKLWLETEGERSDGDEAGRAEVLWDRVLSRWWSLQAGARQDFGAGPSRTWAAVGLQGLAPYFFEIDAAFYLGAHGRTALRFSAEHDLLITQRLVLQPELELDAYGKDDVRNEIASGLSDVKLGLRLRYEIRRELAPYVGIRWQRQLGNTADLARADGRDVSDLAFLAGVRAWF